jgi:hypothetical protein
VARGAEPVPPDARRIEQSFPLITWKQGFLVQEVHKLGPTNRASIDPFRSRCNSLTLLHLITHCQPASSRLRPARQPFRCRFSRAVRGSINSSNMLHLQAGRLGLDVCSSRSGGALAPTLQDVNLSEFQNRLKANCNKARAPLDSLCHRTSNSSYQNDQKKL